MSISGFTGFNGTYEEYVEYTNMHHINDGVLPSLYQCFDTNYFKTNATLIIYTVS